MMQEGNILLIGDSYFYDFLNSKVRSTELGLYILDSIIEDLSKKELPVNHQTIVIYKSIIALGSELGYELDLVILTFRVSLSSATDFFVLYYKTENTVSICCSRV